VGSPSFCNELFISEWPRTVEVSPLCVVISIFVKAISENPAIVKPLARNSGRLPERTGGRRSRLRYAFDVSSHLFVREFRAKYRRAVLGWLWSIAQPLIRYLVFAFVFLKIFSSDIDNFPAFLFSGLIFWTFFSSALLAVTSCFSARRDLLFRPGLPRWSVALTSVLVEMLDLLAALPVLLFVFLVTGVPIQPNFVVLPLLVVLTGLFAWGFGMILAIANIHFRDVRFVVEVVMLLGVYVSPVFYRLDRVPQSYRGWFQLNPMTNILTMLHGALLENSFPSAGPLLLTSLAAVGVAALGLVLFERSSGNFVDML
jgi:lipopolysaccharide transport system permease protein